MLMCFHDADSTLSRPSVQNPMALDLPALSQRTTSGHFAVVPCVMQQCLLTPPSSTSLPTLHHYHRDYCQRLTRRDNWFAWAILCMHMQHVVCANCVEYLRPSVATLASRLRYIAQCGHISRRSHKRVESSPFFCWFIVTWGIWGRRRNRSGMDKRYISRRTDVVMLLPTSSRS